MAEDRTTYRRVRLLTGFVTPVLLAGALLAFARLSDGAWEPGAQVAGICRELLAGTTEGRQALFGSCWVAPLPVLLYLPFAWLLPEPFAGGAAFFTAWLFVFWAVREAVKATGQSGWRIVLAQTAIAVLMVVAKQPLALQVATPLTVGLVLLTAAALADWATFRRLRDVVAAGAAGSFLLLCGFPFFAPAGVAVALVPLAACGAAETRKRFSAWLLLAYLPLVYTLGVWLLMNRLVLGDVFFFVRSLEYLVSDPARFAVASLLPGLWFLPALLLTWILDAWRVSAAIRPLAATAMLIAFALALVSSSAVLAHFDLGWNKAVVSVCVLSVLMVALARLRQPTYRLALVLVVFIGLGMRWFKPLPAEPPKEPREQLCQEVEAHVDAHTSYGRVFVLGYAGLDLLRGYAGDRLVPNMDLHIGSLRRAYKGQNLYLLVPKPEGAARAESVFWKYPDMYLNGGDRLLFSGVFGSWHLFELVSAPTQEQLDEWKRGEVSR
ncbi:MAG: hypothetical protein LBW77_03955 [Verrucomicrobiota bacterium]|jgi:hypothetical protein|nr:hypothetical protein [Verrucomicrobiota bacterium]